MESGIQEFLKLKKVVLSKWTGLTTVLGDREGLEHMNPPNRLSTLDSHVLIAALKENGPHSEKRTQILSKVP